MTDSVHHPKILRTQVPLLRGNREKYNKIGHLLLNHFRPQQQNLSEEQKLAYFQSLLRDDAIKLWQSLKTTNKTRLAQILRYFKKSMPKKIEKKWKNTTSTRSAMIHRPKRSMIFSTNTRKWPNRHSGTDRVTLEKFLFAKLPVQMQNELAMAGKHDATMEEIRTFVQPLPHVATSQSSNFQHQQNRER